MNRIFYFFVKDTTDDSLIENPICSDEFLGDIGDVIEWFGQDYTIVDYAIDVVEDEGDSLYW